MDDIEKLIDFIVEIEKLKSVQRKTRPINLSRYENSAEHSWHVCLSALILKEYANEEINIDRVIKMLLIHDLGEIDAGDTIIYEAETEAIKEKESTGIKRILNFLPNSEAAAYFELWDEFERGESADSKYAKAIDRIPPLLHNLHGDGHSWKENQITREQVFSINSRIKEGSQKLWDVMEKKLEGAVSDGVLK